MESTPKKDKIHATKIPIKNPPNIIPLHSKA
jgi:hypothetical protein